MSTNLFYTLLCVICSQTFFYNTTECKKTWHKVLGYLVGIVVLMYCPILWFDSEPWGWIGALILLVISLGLPIPRKIIGYCGWWSSIKITSVILATSIIPCFFQGASTVCIVLILMETIFILMLGLFFGLIEWANMTQ